MLESYSPENPLVSAQEPPEKFSYLLTTEIFFWGGGAKLTAKRLKKVFEEIVKKKDKIKQDIPFSFIFLD